MNIIDCITESLGNIINYANDQANIKYTIDLEVLR